MIVFFMFILFLQVRIKLAEIGESSITLLFVNINKGEFLQKSRFSIFGNKLSKFKSIEKLLEEYSFRSTSIYYI